MRMVPLKLVTIVAEAVLEGRLAADVLACGASGYTVSDAQGEGGRGLRSAGIGGQNVRLETVVPEEVARRIMLRLSEAYFPHYAIVAWMTTVEVVREERYTRPSD